MLDLLFPPRCGGCARMGAWLCPGCVAGVVSPIPPLCPRCWAELEFDGANCSCRRRLRHLDEVRWWGRYEGRLEHAIWALKYRGRRPLAQALAREATTHLGFTQAPDCLVAVPLSRARQSHRGFNQAALISAHLSGALCLPALGGGLVRIRDTPSQVGLDRGRRTANVEGAFAWRGRALAGCHVLLVDDVMTTGATLNASALALRQGGARRVTGFTLARVGI